jgi:hypothetical protein
LFRSDADFKLVCLSYILRSASKFNNALKAEGDKFPSKPSSRYSLYDSNVSQSNAMRNKWKDLKQRRGFFTLHSMNLETVGISTGKLCNHSIITNLRCRSDFIIECEHILILRNIKDPLGPPRDRLGTSTPNVGYTLPHPYNCSFLDAFFLFMCRAFDLAAASAIFDLYLHLFEYVNLRDFEQT